MTDQQHNVAIIEQFGSYSPPFPVRETIEDLLCGISNQYVRGLHAVVLSSSSGLNRKSRRQKTLSRKRKVAIMDCRGIYNQKWHNDPATIQLFVDNIIESLPLWMFKIQFLRRGIFGEVLFHEIGHHIHNTSVPEYKEREDVAEQWRKKLSKEYGKKRYPYLRRLKPVMKAMIFAAILVVKIADYFMMKGKLKS